MPSPVLENAYLLQSLGWAIVNSLWQTGILWLLFVLITGIDKKLPALVKHMVGLILLAASFVWFISTILQTYRLLSGGLNTTAISLGDEWVIRTQYFNNALPVLSFIYLVLLCYYLARFIKNLSVNRMLQTEGLTKAPLDFRLFITRTAFHLGIKKNVRVWLSEQVDVPCVTGFLKPVILLPAAIISQLSILQTEAVLLHELAHIKRNDYLVNLIQSVVELILFFNPFAILLSKATKKERENCCDDWVMNFQYDHYEYARALLILEEQRQLLQFRFALAVTNNGKKNLLIRVKRLFSVTPKTDLSSLQKIKLLSLCILLFAAIATILPALTKKSRTGNAPSYVGEERTQLVTVSDKTENVVKSKVIKNGPVKPLLEKASSRKPKRLPVKPVPDYYVDAVVNEELIKPVDPIEPMISQVVEKERIDKKVFVKIEEQQSGKKETYTYYFEVNSKDGNTAVKPLIMLNRTKAPAKRVFLNNLTRSVDTLTKQAYKKKVTS